jgi:hypothetical protein
MRFDVLAVSQNFTDSDIMFAIGFEFESLTDIIVFSDSEIACAIGLCCIIIAVSLSFLGGGVVCAINLRFFDLALSRVLSRSRDVARFPGQWNHVRLQPLLCRERRSSSWSIAI